MDHGSPGRGVESLAGPPCPREPVPTTPCCPLPAPMCQAATPLPNAGEKTSVSCGTPASTALEFQQTGTVAVRLKERIVRATLQRAAARDNFPMRMPSTAHLAVHETLRSRGQLLDADTRAYFEPRYGHDFSRVRVHADAQASETARAMDAAAYTVGSQIAFAQGRYQPGTAAGRRLLAHELAHVAQQRNASVPGTLLEVGKPSDAAERAADAAAQHALVHATTRTVDAIDGSATVRRTPVESWAGTFDKDLQYDLTSENNGKGEGSYGSAIQIRFTPKPVVRADKVALVQTVVSRWNDQTWF